MTEGSPPSDKELRRRSAAALFLKVHDLALGDAADSQRPVELLCSLMLSESLLAGGDGLRVCAATTEGAQIQVHRAGSWVDMMRVPAPVQAYIINRLKVMANLDVARHPLQEGALKVRFQDQVLALAITVQLRGDAEEATLDFPPRSSDAGAAT